ncbi:hypothetical protein [Luteibacter sp. RCC_6_2]|uniref:hypothetical protein n=1 Tax=Luteibacter sp. RCC_6_2 TaxID=3239223 RepID=UPI003523DE31
MTFDKPEHQDIVAQLIQHASFPGHVIELAVELKAAVTNANISGSTDLSGRQ